MASFGIHTKRPKFKFAWWCLTGRPQLVGQWIARDERRRKLSEVPILDVVKTWNDQVKRLASVLETENSMIANAPHFDKWDLIAAEIDRQLRAAIHGEGKRNA